MASVVSHGLMNWTAGAANWGDPARASREMGEALIEQRVARAFQIAQAALRGDDLSSMPRNPDNNPEVISETEQARRLALERYETQRDEIELWMQRNPWPPRQD